MNQMLTIPDIRPVRRGLWLRHVWSLLKSPFAWISPVRLGAHLSDRAGASSLPDDLMRDVGLEPDLPRRGGGALSAGWSRGTEVRLPQELR